MATNPFVWDVDEYRRDYNIVKGAFEDAAHYLSRSTGDDYATCLTYVKKTLSPGGALGMKDPEVRMLHRDEGTDRKRGLTTVTRYLKHVQDNNLIMAPTMTVYDREENNPSLLAGYTDGRIAERKVFKKQKFDYDRAGDKTASSIADSQQASCKIDANSLSGAHNSEYTILFIKSAHSTLTSTCRSATAYANANNEKFVQGNRHYWKPDIVYSNIAATCANANLKGIQYVCERFGLVYPTVEDTIACIRRSTDLYWTSDVHMAKLRQYAEGMDPVERAAFVYVGDLYHLAILNPVAVRQLFDDFVLPPSQTAPEPDAIIEWMDSDLLATVSVMMQDIFRGKSVNDIRQNPEHKQRLADKLLQIQQALQYYEPLIQHLWASAAAPASVAVFPDSVRRTVIAGDTDSTIFTVQWWVDWYCGHVAFDEAAYSVGALVVYFTSQMVIHLLASFSASMGVSKKHLFRLEMKNEFCFPIFTPTNRSKHYFAYQLAQEGNVFTEKRLELKGAELRSAQTPAPIKALEMDLIKEMMDEVIHNGTMSGKDKLYQVAKIEHRIRKDIQSNAHGWFRTRQLKAKETYTNPYSSIYQYYEMWNEVFGPKYGMVDEPPYMAVSFKVAAKNKTEIQEWLSSITDVDVRKRLQQWMSRNNKEQLTEIMLPLPVIEGTGVPEELVQGANLNKVIYTIMSPFYIILETLGFYYPTKPYIALVSDEITEADVDAYFQESPTS